MVYVKIIYQNSPSTATPINAQNLNHMDDGIAENDRRLNELETAGVVNKFNGRSGNVTPTKGDYDIADIGATDGQDGYVPVWRNSGTEEDPNWGFEMEAQGGAGHVLVDSDGNDMPSENKMQFADAFLTDDDVNDKTIVENIKEVDPADYDSTTDEGIIVTDDGEDAVIHPSSDDKVEVTADGNTSYTTLFNSFYSQSIDRSKLRNDSVLVFEKPNGTKYYSRISALYSDAIIFSEITEYAASTLYSKVIKFATTGSFMADRANTTDTVYESQLVPQNTKITLYYGNKKAVVDLQTTANRCLMSDGVTSVEDAIDGTISQLSVNTSYVQLYDGLYNGYARSGYLHNITGYIKATANIPNGTTIINPPSQKYMPSTIMGLYLQALDGTIYECGWDKTLGLYCDSSIPSGTKFRLNFTWYKKY